MEKDGTIDPAQRTRGYLQININAQSNSIEIPNSLSAHQRWIRSSRRADTAKKIGLIRVLSCSQEISMINPGEMFKSTNLKQFRAVGTRLYETLHFKWWELFKGGISTAVCDFLRISPPEQKSQAGSLIDEALPGKRVIVLIENYLYKSSRIQGSR